MIKVNAIRRLLQAVYRPVAASPEFREKLLKRLGKLKP